MNYKFFILFFLFVIPYSVFSQKKINCYKHKERQGLWIVYKDSLNLQIESKGKYRKGVPKGKWKYYDGNGKLYKTERTFFKRIYTRFYYPDGKLQKKGKARIVITEKLWHYYYFGKWKVYNPNGELIKLMYYKDGNFVSEKKVLSSRDAGLNTTLAESIRKLDKQFHDFSDSLITTKINFGVNSTQYKRILRVFNTSSLMILDSIDCIISTYSYPGKTLVGSDYAIIFSIISSSNTSIREKYYNVIINAADVGELDWKDVAFFVDKVKVAKREKQEYGTQFKFDSAKKEAVYYPINDKPHLNERRSKVGLDEYNLEELNDSQNY